MLRKTPLPGILVATSIFLNLLALQTTAKELRVVNPEREGLSQERLDRISNHMNQAIDDGIMVGGIAKIARNGKVVYSKTYGQSDREANIPMTDDAIFRIYSMSKPITSVALMVLYEEGRFFLNDAIADYIPELANLEVALSTADSELNMTSDGTTSRAYDAGDEGKTEQTRKPKRQPTIRDLLRHTAGFTYGFFGNTEVDKKYSEKNILMGNTNLEEFVTELGKLPLQYEPGTKWHYSVAVDVQGRLIEVLSGVTLGEFLDKRIFQPLGMTDTGFIVPKSKLDRFTQMYSPPNTGEGNDFFLNQENSTELVPSSESLSAGYMEGSTMEAGGTGLVSTAMDYLRFCQMMLNGGILDGARILSPKTVELMTMNHLGSASNGFGERGVGFGLGFLLALDQGKIGELGSAGEYSWGGAAGTGFWIDPTEQLIGVFMVQSLPHKTRLRSEFKNLTYQAIIK
tara:strand:+ start:535 stop:1905 length:1371 start_codon:yes stop_codon:yes gene_type:complete